jgi:hypothetical protein
VKGRWRDSAESRSLDPLESPGFAHDVIRNRHESYLHFTGSRWLPFEVTRFRRWNAIQWISSNPNRFTGALIDSQVRTHDSLENQGFRIKICA